MLSLCVYVLTGRTADDYAANAGNSNVRAVIAEFSSRGSATKASSGYGSPAANISGIH